MINASKPNGGKTNLGKNIIHADLVRVDMTEMVKVAVPIDQTLQQAGPQ